MAAVVASALTPSVAAAEERDGVVLQVAGGVGVPVVQASPGSVMARTSADYTLPINTMDAAIGVFVTPNLALTARSGLVMGLKNADGKRHADQNLLLGAEYWLDGVFSVGASGGLVYYMPFDLLSPFDSADDVLDESPELGWALQGQAAMTLFRPPLPEDSLDGGMELRLVFLSRASFYDDAQIQTTSALLEFLYP